MKSKSARKTARKLRKRTGGEIGKPPVVSVINYENAKKLFDEVTSYSSCKLNEISESDKFKICNKIYEFNTKIIENIRNSDSEKFEYELREILMLYKYKNEDTNVNKKKFHDESCGDDEKFAYLIAKFAYLKYIYDNNKEKDDKGKTSIVLQIPVALLSWDVSTLGEKIRNYVTKGKKMVETVICVDDIFTKEVLDDMDEIDRDIDEYRSCMRESSGWGFGFGGDSRKLRKTKRRSNKRLI
jgi:hypothetical protein